MPLAAIDFAFHFSAASFWFWLMVLIGLIWLRRHLQLNRARHIPTLTVAAAGGDEPLPVLTVLVAAKDEEANIGTCLTGLRAQDYPDLEIIVINDRSDDRTAEIIDAIAAEDSRVRAVHITDLPTGWFGKMHAMHVGAQQARGELLCFTDADCRFHAPELMTAAVRYAQREQVDFLSVLPHLEAGTFWEKVVQPPAGGILMFWNPPEKVNDPASSRAYANGAFMLLTQACYNAIGRHESFPAVLNEDMHMARRVKEIGQRLLVLPGAGLYSVRMYVGFKQIWRGWSRIFYGCFGGLHRLLLSAVFLSLFSLSPYVALLVGPIVGGDGYWISAAALFAVVVQQSVLWRYYPLSGLPSVWALSYPLGAGLCAAMTLDGATRYFGRTTNWRGTVYEGGA